MADACWNPVLPPRRYTILAPNALPKGFVDARAATEKLLEATKLDDGEYRLGFTKVRFLFSLQPISNGNNDRTNLANEKKIGNELRSLPLT